MTPIAQNITMIREKIARAAQACGRAPDSVHLVAVSKTQAPERIQGALDAGLRLFGENRVQEAKERWAGLKEKYPDLVLHFIGPLQTNKVKDAVKLFDVIETLDRPKLARALSVEMKKQNRFLSCFIQVNTGAEEQKAGVSPEALPEFLTLCREDCGLGIRGLMCIPPVDEPPAAHFALLKTLARKQNLSELSMGMSADFEEAIAQGATHVRIGTALFGGR